MKSFILTVLVLAVSPASSLAEKGDNREASRPPDRWNVLKQNYPREPIVKHYRGDVCIVGGGSAGLGAAIAAAREGAKVILVERQKRLGGTGVNAMVSNWEPGPGCSIAREMYDQMKAVGGAGVAVRRPVSTDAPMGYHLVDPEEPYENSLLRAIPPKGGLRRLPYQPEVFDRVARNMLAETGNVLVLDETIFFDAELDQTGRQITSLFARNPRQETVRLEADTYIDSSGGVWLCRSVGCEVMLGIDPRSRFGEPSAPEKSSLQLNAISRCYLIRPAESPQPAPPPEESVRFPKCAFVTGWKDGPQTVNPMPMLPGKALIELGYEESLRRTEKQARAHWHWLQQIQEFQGYELAEIAPMLGIRESYRVVTDYVLREDDLRKGLGKQNHSDIIAIADHPCDIHGAGGHLAPVATAYGIPYRCLLPASGPENLQVACRGSGFSKIAASSCRLQRTMIQMGHAAGMAAAMAVDEGVPPQQIDVAELVRRLDAKSRYPAEWISSE